MFELVELWTNIEACNLLLPDKWTSCTRSPTRSSGKSSSHCTSYRTCQASKCGADSNHSCHTIEKLFECNSSVNILIFVESQGPVVLAQRCCNCADLESLAETSEK